MARDCALFYKRMIVYEASFAFRGFPISFYRNVFHGLFHPGHTIDCTKGFHSIHWETLWKIARMHGISERLAAPVAHAAPAGYGLCLSSIKRPEPPMNEVERIVMADL